MPAGQESDDLTSRRVHPNLRPSSSYSVPLFQPGPPGKGKSLLPALPHLCLPPGSVCHCVPRHTTFFTARLWATPTGGLSARPSVGEHALTHTTHTHCSLASHHGLRSGRLTWVPCCAQPSLLSLALPQPCCWWGSRAGSPSDSEFLWHMMCLPCPSP